MVVQEVIHEQATITSEQIGRYVATLACPESKHHYNGGVWYWESGWLSPDEASPAMTAQHNLILSVEQSIQEESTG
jgi:hypothetical protein